MFGNCQTVALTLCFAHSELEGFQEKLNAIFEVVQNEQVPDISQETE